MENNLKHRTETLTYPGGYKWTGEWKDDSMYEGKGSIIIRASNVRYDGQVHKDKLYGKITIIYPDGKKFKGEVISGKKYVEGTMIYPTAENIISHSVMLFYPVFNNLIQNIF